MSICLRWQGLHKGGEGCVKDFEFVLVAHNSEN